MRRGFAIVAVVLLLLAGIGIGVAAYNAGIDEGIQRQLVESGQGVDVVRVVGDGVGPGFGVFPFGFLFFPLFLFGIFALVRAATWRARWGGHDHRGHGGPWKDHAGDRFEEWHRAQHERSGATSAGGEPA